MPGRAVMKIFLLALLLRVAFVLWSPGEPTGDGVFYHQHARDLMLGNGYVNFDRSPANTWMPGWSSWLALLYGLFGFEPRVGMLANAVLGAGTAALLVPLGEKLFRRRVGEIGGLLYALWPGVIYYSATLFNETLFSFLLVVAANVAVWAARSETTRLPRFAFAGGLLGGCALVKAEPLVLTGAFAAFFFVEIFARRRRPRAFVAATTLFVVCAALVVLPWSIRNYRTFDRVIPTVAGSGMVVAAANHMGASGGNDLAFLLAYLQELGVEHATQAEQNIAMYDDGWRRAGSFVRDNPAEALRLMGRKMRLTYAGDSEGATLVRGFFGREKWHLSEGTWRGLSRVSDIYWFAMWLPLCIGFARLRDWPRSTRALILGSLATWLVLHLVFMGGERFHHPEVLFYALVAAFGIEHVFEREFRHRPASGA